MNTDGLEMQEEKILGKENMNKRFQILFWFRPFYVHLYALTHTSLNSLV